MNRNYGRQEAGPRICVIGVGSPFGADAVGMDAVDQLRSRSALCGCGRNLSFQQLDRPGPALLEELRDSDVAVIIDAMQAGLPPGTVRCIELGELLERPTKLSVHDFGVAQAVALGQALGDLPSILVLVGIEIGEGHTPVPLEVQELEEIVDRVIRNAADGRNACAGVRAR